MFQAKDLSEEQIAKLKEWTSQGDQLADLQRQLKEEFSLSVTYMDMRFVALDLGLEFVNPEPEPEPEEETADDAVAPEEATQMGRPSLDPDTPNYQPAQQDVADFQVELRKLLEGNSSLGL